MIFSWDTILTIQKIIDKIIIVIVFITMIPAIPLGLMIRVQEISNSAFKELKNKCRHKWLKKNLNTDYLNKLIKQGDCPSRYGLDDCCYDSMPEWDERRRIMFNQRDCSGHECKSCWYRAVYEKGYRDNA